MWDTSNRYLQLYSSIYVAVWSWVSIDCMSTVQNHSPADFRKSVLRVTWITLADSHQGRERFQCRQELKVTMGPRYFLSFSFLTACNGSNVLFSSIHPCIAIPSVFHVTLLFLLSPWVMLNTLFPILIGVASSHLFKVSLLWFKSLQADSGELCSLAGK